MSPLPCEHGVQARQCVVCELTERVRVLEGHRKAWRTIARRLVEMVPAARRAELDEWFDADGRLREVEA